MRSALLLMLVVFLVVPAAAHGQQMQPTPTGPNLQQTIATINKAYDEQGVVKFQVQWSRDTQTEQNVLTNHAMPSPISSCLLTFSPDQPWYLPVDLRKVAPRLIEVEPFDDYYRSTYKLTSDEEITPHDLYVVLAPANPLLPLDAKYRPFLGIFIHRRLADLVQQAYAHAADICHSGDQAQIPSPPPPPPAVGPTMEQTITFINDAFSSRQERIRIALYAPCVLSLGMRDDAAADWNTWHLKLSRIDPRKVIVDNQHISKSWKVLLQDPDAGYQILAFSSSQDEAEHVARAYIHAIALCHKPEDAPLF